MRGWERVGVVRVDGEFVIEGTWTPAFLTDSDIVCVSPNRDGTQMRCGSVRMRDVRHCSWSLDSYIPAATAGDHVFRAIALGEHAFSRGEPSAPSAPP